MRIVRRHLLLTFFVLLQICSFIPTLVYMRRQELSQREIMSTPAPPKAFREGDLFAPGSLPWNRTFVFRQCYVDPQIYRYHFRDQNLRLVSQRYGLAYHMVAKAGSSSARIVMSDHFQAIPTHKQPLNMTNFSFVREPTSRFISAYQESLKRMLIQPGKSRPAEGPLAFLKQLGHRNYKTYRKAAATEEGRIQSTRLFESFLKDYDGSKPFEGHLRLQLPRLASNVTGRTLPMNDLVDTQDMTPYFQHMAKQLHLPPIPEKHAYQRGTRLLNPLSSTAIRKICQLSALDYCCLNYALPPECKGALSCRIIKRHDELLVEPVLAFPASEKAEELSK